jgi:hypothetical protein
VSGLAAHLLWLGDRHEVSLEAITATRSFDALEPDRNRPSAWNLEYSYFASERLDWALRVEGSRELEDEPRLRYGAALNIRVLRNATLTLEWLHGRFRGELATDDGDVPYRHVDSIGALLAVAF